MLGVGLTEEWQKIRKLKGGNYRGKNLEKLDSLQWNQKSLKI